jgi:hypothetical protein
MEYALIFYTDLDIALGKTIEGTQLTRSEHSSRRLCPSVGRNPHIKCMTSRVHNIGWMTWKERYYCLPWSPTAVIRRRIGAS